MVTVTRYVWIASLAVVLLVGGCKVGPDYSRPETEAETAARFVNTPEPAAEANEVSASESVTDVNEVEALDRWWERFGDPVTAELVREALEENYDLKAAAARVLQARSGLTQARGALWPDVTYNLLRNRSKQFINFGGSGGGFSDPNSGFDFSGFKFSPLTTTWAQDISVTYLVDLWGKLRRSQRAAWEDLLATEADRQALVNSVVATVVEARINIAVAQRRLALAQSNTESLQRTLDITERRYQQGLVGPVDVRLARASLESSRAQEPALKTSLATARHALDVLVGRRPGASEDLPRTLPALPELGPVPVGVPGALLERRPDVRAAEFALRAANERVGVSIAQLYPDLVLSAGYGRSSDRWEDIWRDFSETYSAAVNLSQPIFQGGRLRAQVDAAKARYEELAATYGGVVLKAMREVEDALISERLLQEQLGHVQVGLEESVEAERLARLRYRAGVESILAVLASERQRYAAEEQLAVLEGQIWTTRVNLHLALGGDWGVPVETETEVVKK